MGLICIAAVIHVFLTINSQKVILTALPLWFRVVVVLDHFIFHCYNYKIHNFETIFK
ncbi:hypothetical protein KL86CLO1_10102 [uncultured Eubacteriales bacterium]|uniref:Uncharacterized protein n=1 Tax=uncultured Eubacteriales bacterium TaxID=172733 RepID=A0A212IVV6_9FIRM|nr:hypothetical protein KL86CLO1_10102 [uncultured Eubacteriales bacterium]